MRPVVRDSVAVAIATGVYGVSFGAIGVANGLDVWQTCALSLVAFTGASQFAFVGVVGSGGSPLFAAFSGFMLGTRNTLYGVRLAELLPWRGARRAAAAHLVIDETTAITVSRETREDSRLGFLVTGLGIFVLWNAFTVVGAVAGEALGDPRTLGLDAAVGGAFLALLWPRLESSRHRVTALLGAGLALSLVPLAPAGVPVIAAGVVALGLGLLVRERAA